MTVISHKPAQVLEILVANNARVGIGNQILRLDTIDEDLKLARISAMKEMRAILAKRLEDPVVAVHRKIAQIAVDASVSFEKMAEDLTNRDAIQAYLGNVISPVVLAQNLTTAIPAGFQHKTALLQQKQMELQLTESTSINELIRDHLEIELQVATTLKSRATFTALSDGQVHLKVTRGQFVKKGEILFEVA